MIAKITKIRYVARRRHQECHCANIVSIWGLCIGIGLVKVVVVVVVVGIVNDLDLDLLYDFFRLQQLLLNI